MASQSDYGGRWEADIPGMQAGYQDVYNKMLKSATGERSAQQAAIQAQLRRRGLQNSGIASQTMGQFAEGLQRADLGMALDIANAQTQIAENEYNRRFQQHMFEYEKNAQRLEKRKQGKGWGALAGTVAGTLLTGGNPAAYMGVDAAQVGVGGGRGLNTLGVGMGQSFTRSPQGNAYTRQTPAQAAAMNQMNAGYGEMLSNIPLFNRGYQAGSTSGFPNYLGPRPRY